MCERCRADCEREAHTAQEEGDFPDGGLSLYYSRDKGNAKGGGPGEILLPLKWGKIVKFRGDFSGKADEY
jgi:hypothetical protein